VRLRPLLILFILSVAALSATYADTVERGRMSMRKEFAWEVAWSGSNPFETAIYAEQRLPWYPAEWLAPALDVIHAFDVRLRWEYWHESDIPEFDTVPDFELMPPTAPSPPTAGSPSPDGDSATSAHSTSCPLNSESP
jgi:hypothetical protein